MHHADNRDPSGDGGQLRPNTHSEQSTGGALQHEHARVPTSRVAQKGERPDAPIAVVALQHVQRKHSVGGKHQPEVARAQQRIGTDNAPDCHSKDG